MNDRSPAAPRWLLLLTLLVLLATACGRRAIIVIDTEDSETSETVDDHAPAHAPVVTMTPQPTARPAGTGPATAIPARYNLGTGLGTPVPATQPALGPAVAGDEPIVVSGLIESVSGPAVVIRTPSGSRRVQLSEQSRLEREGPGRVDDLRPGEIVGVVQAPGGPATMVRLYSKGPGMPRRGMVPMLGAQLGQVTTFGTIVGVQAGNLIVNNGVGTMPIVVPPGVTVLKPARVAPGDLKVGAAVTVTGSEIGEGVVEAPSLRMTTEGPLAR